jgi:hypothetical protein
LPTVQFKKKLKAVLSVMPEEYKDDIKEELRYSNTPKLHNRLAELLTEFEGLDIEIKKYYDSSFINSVKKSRNHYTHNGNKPVKTGVMKSEQLKELTQQCRTLINFLILKNIGIKSDVLSETFKYYIEMDHYSRYYS